MANHCVLVAQDDTNQRLDRWLRGRFPVLNQALIEKLCRKGHIRIDSQRAKAATRVFAGQSVDVPAFLFNSTQSTAQTYGHVDCYDSAINANGFYANAIKKSVLYVDDDILVLNKPVGLACQGGSQQRTSIDQLAYCVCDDQVRPKLVHRLDKDTSGVLILARHRRASVVLAKAFKERLIKKIYWALVVGVPPCAQGVIDRGIKEKSAMTHYVRLACIESFAWLALMPLTGRTHQLRIHMADMGCMICGEKKYADLDRAYIGSPTDKVCGLPNRLCLHARSLFLRHPITDKPLHFVAPMPQHMRSFWQGVQWDTDGVPADPFVDIGQRE